MHLRLISWFLSPRAWRQEVCWKQRGVKPLPKQVIAAAKEGFRAVGYELNPWLVWYSRYRARREGVHHNATFYISDLWKVSFSQYTNVVIFGVPQMMSQLEKKLQMELDDNARVIACRFPFPHWVPGHISGEGVDTVWTYDCGTFRKTNDSGSDTQKQILSEKAI